MFFRNHLWVKGSDHKRAIGSELIVVGYQLEFLDLLIQLFETFVLEMRGSRFEWHCLTGLAV